MTEHPSDQNQEQPPEETPSRPSIDPSMVIRRSRPRQGDGRSRWLMVGCVAGLIVVFGFFYASFSMISRSMVGLADRASARVRRQLPIELDSGQRQRLLDNLDRVERAIREGGDSKALVGGFLGCVAPAVEDDLLTVSEVEALNRCIEARVGGDAGEAGD